MADVLFERLRRFPDIEAGNLHAVDASDRLILDLAADRLDAAEPGTVVTVGDRYGALTLGAAAGRALGEIGVHQDSITGELALANNRRLLAEPGGPAGVEPVIAHRGPGPELFGGARLVLWQLPRGLAELEEIADGIARYGDPGTTVFAGGRIKHMSPAMTELLRRFFSEVEVSLARQKSRVLIARAPIAPESAPRFPERHFHQDLGLWVSAHGAAFAGTKLDIGTRFLLGFLDRVGISEGTAIDLGCGTGLLAAALAKAKPGLEVIASDQSAAAVASARDTLAANGFDPDEPGSRVRVLRDDAVGSLAAGGTDLVVCNPPFHAGATVQPAVGLKLFAAAARVLRPGGELWAVFNRHLDHVGALRRLVGRTDVIGRNSKFIVTRSVRR